MSLPVPVSTGSSHPAPALSRATDLEIKDAQLIFGAVWQELEADIGRENLRFPKEIILLGGAPGAGKGTNTAFIARARGLTCPPIVISALLEGAIIFIRLVAPENLYGSVPVAYQVGSVQPMNCNGLCEMRLLRLQPRSRGRAKNENASPSADSSSKAYQPKQSSIQSELEEVLHEA